MKLAAAYVRVSTGKQRDDGVSVEMQISKIRAYAALHDLAVVAVYGDAESARSIKGRPGMQAVLSLAKKRQIACVLVFKLDRAFRNTVEALETAQTLDKCGVALHSLSENLDTKSAIGEFSFTLMASLAQMERKVISERTAAAMAHLKSEGRYCGGQAPYGYAVVDGKLVVNAEEMLVVEKVRGLKTDGMSYRAIVTALDVEGIRTRRGTRFQLAQIQRIIRST